MARINPTVEAVARIVKIDSAGSYHGPFYDSRQLVAELYGYIYEATRSGIWTIRYTDTTMEFLPKQYEPREFTSSVSASGHELQLGRPDGIELADVTDPGNPMKKLFHLTGYMPRHVIRYGEFIYATSDKYVLEVFRVVPAGTFPSLPPVARLPVPPGGCMDPSSAISPNTPKPAISHRMIPGINAKGQHLRKPGKSTVILKRENSTSSDATRRP